MQHFVNEYEYTPDVLKESVGAWWNYKFRNGYRSMLTVSVLIVILSIVMKQPLLLLAELAPLAVTALFILKKKKAIQIEEERIDTLFHDAAVSYRVETGEDICVTSPKGTNRISFSDIENYVETGNLIVLFLKGSMTLALDKKGSERAQKRTFCLK